LLVVAATATFVVIIPYQYSTKRRFYIVLGPSSHVDTLPAAVRHMNNLHSCKSRHKPHFLVCVLVIDNVMLFMSNFVVSGPGMLHEHMLCRM